MEQNLRIYNTLKRKVEPFVPIEDGKIRMYACGITVYDESHVGHASQAIIFDTVRRILEYLGYKVTYVRNFTDIDDKIIKKANQAGKTPDEISNFYIEDSVKDLESVKVRPANHEPKVTDHIEDIIAFVKKLVDKGAAYVQGNEVLFDVLAFDGYGKLSGQKIDQLESADESSNKKNPQDFSLWKPAKEGEPSWDSPWGPGRPGWHIECSVMANVFLGETLDIHGGGHDLVFPHHENEVAQSEACSGKTFANFWIHNGLVMVGGRKMSKSLGNFYTIKDIVKKFHPDIVRFTVLSTQYSSHIDFSETIFRISSKRVHYFYKTLHTIDELLKNEPANENNLQPELIESIQKDFREDVSENFNTAKALANFSGLFQQINTFITSKKPKMKQKLYTLKLFREEFSKLTAVLGIFDEEPAAFLNQFKRRFIEENGITESEIEAKINERAEARKNKDFAAADAIREQLKEKKIQLMDTPQGVQWDVWFD